MKKTYNRATAEYQEQEQYLTFQKEEYTEFFRQIRLIIDNTENTYNCLQNIIIRDHYNIHELEHIITMLLADIKKISN